MAKPISVGGLFILRSSNFAQNYLSLPIVTAPPFRKFQLLQIRQQSHHLNISEYILNSEKSIFKKRYRAFMMIFDITRKGFMVLIVVTIPNVIPPPPDLPPPPNGDSHHLLNDTNARMSNNIENSNSLILFYIANFVAGISSLIVVSREPIFYFVPRENNILDGDLRKGKDCRFFRQFCCENCSLFHSRTSDNWFSN